MKIRKQVQDKNKHQDLICMNDKQESIAENDEEKHEQGSNGEEEQGKTIVVGIKMDSESRELLTWALVKVASPGDCVVALHIIPSSKDSSVIDVKSPSSMLSMVKAFDSVIEVYEGFCNLRQVELKMKICRGSSIRKVLVQESKSYEASRLILGVAKNGRPIGYSPTSVARYCAKKLSENCLVLAVNNGKIVFQREIMLSSRHSVRRIESIQSSVKHRLVESRSIVENQIARKSTASRPSFHSSSSVTSSSSSSGSSIDNSFSLENSSENNDNKLNTESKKYKSVDIIPGKKAEIPLCKLFQDMPDAKPGWPLLRKAMASDKSASSARTKISVVQWAMQLPDRNLAASATNSDTQISKMVDKKSRLTDTTNNALTTPELIQGKRKKISKNLEYFREKYSSVCRFFSYQELINITHNFSAENLVGEGGSSRVYKGCLSDGKELAVKILNSLENAVSEFVTEIEIVTSLHHKNITSLFGFCFEDDKLILIYEFLSRGSLEDNLHDRYKVAVGVAKALSYLHGADNDKPVIHRDVKSSNILLDDDFNPQLSDFGLAQWATEASTTPFTCHDVAGTFGYLAPEYFMYGKVNEMIDVYAFGVVLLELLSGRKPVSSGYPKGPESLVMWAIQIIQGGKLKLLVDPCIEPNIDEDQLERLTLAASLCIRRTPQSRPRMEVVSKLLQGDEETLQWAIQQFHSAEDEAETTKSNIQSHINLAFLDIDDDDAVSVSSSEPVVDFLTANKSLEEYLQGRWSRSSSFD